MADNPGAVLVAIRERILAATSIAGDTTAGAWPEDAVLVVGDRPTISPPSIPFVTISAGVGEIDESGLDVETVEVRVHVSDDADLAEADRRALSAEDGLHARLRLITRALHRSFLDDELDPGSLVEPLTLIGRTSTESASVNDNAIVSRASTFRYAIDLDIGQTPEA